MSKNPETAERESLKTCATRALEALGALKKAITTFRQLPQPKDVMEREMHDEIARRLKVVYGEIMAVVFATSMAIDTTTPQIPRIH